MRWPGGLSPARVLRSLAATDGLRITGLEKIVRNPQVRHILEDTNETRRVTKGRAFSGGRGAMTGGEEV